jgi:hypothetical protein
MIHVTVEAERNIRTAMEQGNKISSRAGKLPTLFICLIEYTWENFDSLQRRNSGLAVIKNRF